jgi:hypothetical protein
MTISSPHQEKKMLLVHSRAKSIASGNKGKGQKGEQKTWPALRQPNARHIQAKEKSGASVPRPGATLLPEFRFLRIECRVSLDHTG